MGGEIRHNNHFTVYLVVLERHSSITPSRGARKGGSGELYIYTHTMLLISLES